jgi:thymidylate synthase (FAD)
LKTVGTQMTLRSEINFENDSNYTPILDHGFVGLVDSMGSDSAVVQAARVSYGAGTKQVNDDRNLIRYLMRHKHTTPFEMCEVKFHLKMPIFVMRQLVRHRTASINEYSARYSVMTDEFYIPELEQIQKQSTTNKQGREESEWFFNDKREVQHAFQRSFHNAYKEYTSLLGKEDNGLARELARSVLPVGGYTELYWKANLKNFLHMIKLRSDPHAQWEIQELANAMYNLVKDKFPQVCEAFEDYEQNAVTASKMEVDLLQALISKDKWNNLLEDHRTEDAIASKFNMGKREIREFIDKWIKD